MKKIFAVIVLGVVAIFVYLNFDQDPSTGATQSLVPNNSAETSAPEKLVAALRDRVFAFGEACASWGVGSRQAYRHATELANADFASTPFTPAEIREMRTEFVETFMARGEYDEAIDHLQKIIAEEDEEQRALDELGTVPDVGYRARIGEAQAVRASMLGQAYDAVNKPADAYQSFRSARFHLGSIYGQDHPNLIYVFQDEIAAADRVRASGLDISSLYCDKRDLRIMQKRAVSEGFVNDDDIVTIPVESVPANADLLCTKPPAIPVEMPLETIKVFYGTNRNVTKSLNPQKAYGYKRGRLTMGSVDMTVRVYSKVGDLPPQGIEDTQLDDDGDDKNHGVHIILTKLNKVGSKSEFSRELGDWVTQSKTGSNEVFVYVHGHNVVFDAAARRAAQLAIDLDMRNGAIFYSWPSGQRMTLYTKSQINAGRSAGHLKEFLETLASVEEIDKIHLIAHSMGNAVLTKALNRMDVEGFSAERRPFGQIVWASPDVASVDFVDYTTKFKSQKMADGMTLYASSMDRALCLSNWLSDMKRAGQTPPLPDVAGVVPTVDTSGGNRAATDLIAHSDYADGAIDDIKAVIWLNLRPDQRCFLGNDLIENVAYWASGKGECNEVAFRSALSIVRARTLAQTDSGYSLDQTLAYVRRDVTLTDWEFAQLLADQLIANQTE